MHLRASDIELIRAAASLAAHAPQRMVAAHLAPKLEELAGRLELVLGRGRAEAQALGARADETRAHDAQPVEPAAATGPSDLPHAA